MGSHSRRLRVYEWWVYAYAALAILIGVWLGIRMQPYAAMLFEAPARHTRPQHVTGASADCYTLCDTLCRDRQALHTIPASLQP